MSFEMDNHLAHRRTNMEKKMIEVTKLDKDATMSSVDSCPWPATEKAPQNDVR